MKFLKFIRQKINLKYCAYVLIAILVFSYGLNFLASALGRLAVIEYFLTLMPQKRLNGMNILALGIDETKTVQRSDTIIVFHLDPMKKRIGMISIPRDTRVNIPGYDVTKINHAYAFGGVSLLKKAVSEFLNIPIDYYIKVNLKGVEGIIDQLGGVSINVDKDLYYQDQAGDLFINIKAGKQTLSGSKLLEFLRFRQDSQGDIGRISRQQTFIRALGNKILESRDILETPKLIMELSSKMETDLSTSEMVNFALQFGEAFKRGQIVTGTVPGAVTMVGGISYWKPDLIGLVRLIDTLLLGFEVNRMAKSQIQTVDPAASKENRRKITLKEAAFIQEQLPDTNKDLKAQLRALVVEVLNGNGKTGEAKVAARMLKAKGMKVPRFGNAASFNYASTVIVDWRGNVEAVLALAKLLHIDPSKIIVYDNSDKKLDATLVLGSDWQTIESNIRQNDYSKSYN